jgi:methionine-rich copper-binding protein CopC
MLRFTAPALLLLVTGFYMAGASAHAGLAQTVPDHDVILERAPTRLHFQFMNSVTLTNIRLEITDGPRAGDRIAIRLPRNNLGQSTAVGATIALDLPPLGPAVYKVIWQATALNGHVLLDDFSFTVADTTTP